MHLTMQAGRDFWVVGKERCRTSLAGLFVMYGHNSCTKDSGLALYFSERLHRSMNKWSSSSTGQSSTWMEGTTRTQGTNPRWESKDSKPKFWWQRGTALFLNDSFSPASGRKESIWAKKKKRLVCFSSARRNERTSKQDVLSPEKFSSTSLSTWTLLRVLKTPSISQPSAPPLAPKWTTYQWAVREPCRAPSCTIPKTSDVAKNSCCCLNSLGLFI